MLRRRVVTLTGELVEDEFITENHAILMYQPLLPDQAVGGGEA